jgi:hypothetical protein
MSEDERMRRLEERVARLEELLEGKRGRVEAGKPLGTQHAGAAVTVRPHVPASPLSSEQWVGQRLLLAVGVTALILAAGYLLRLSFDRGWISPLTRCIGGAIAGFIVGAVGWRLHPRYRTYGAALVGCGAAIIYLSVWAAARLYGVLPPTTGIVGLALVSVALAMIAYAIDVEALGTTAALGAFFAPLLLGRNQADADLLLLYLACMAAGLGLVAARRRWRLAMFVVALSFFGVAYAGAADRGSAWDVLLYGVLGGSAGIHVGLRERWPETRFLSFAGGWTFVHAASHHISSPWPVLLGGIVLATPVWWFGLRSNLELPLPGAPRSGTPAWSLGEAFYFFLTPLLLGWAVHGLAPRWFDTHEGMVSLIVAVPYLVAGYQRPRPIFAVVAVAALGIAAGRHWAGVERVWALLALALLWAALDHRLNRTDGRWYAVATLWAALSHLFSEASQQRTAADPAFVGSWALALWGAVGVTVVLAGRLWRVTAPAGPESVVQALLWAVAGTMVLFGVTREIERFFALRSFSAQTASLAAGLAVSAWWLVFAAALVVAGFRRELKSVRIAGLSVAGLAVVKVLVFDLSSLDALYRVGSVFILGLVFLLLAYLYHRQGRAGPTGQGETI